GFFELNTMMPVAAFNLLQSIDILAGAATVFVEKCIAGLEATENGPRMVEAGLSIATPLATVVGYDRTAELANEAFRTGKTIREVAREAKLLPDAELDQLLEARKMPGRWRRGLCRLRDDRVHDLEPVESLAVLEVL